MKNLLIFVKLINFCKTSLGDIKKCQDVCDWAELLHRTSDIFKLYIKGCLNQYDAEILWDKI